MPGRGALEPPGRDVAWFLLEAPVLTEPPGRDVGWAFLEAVAGLRVVDRFPAPPFRDDFADDFFGEDFALLLAAPRVVELRVMLFRAAGLLPEFRLDVRDEADAFFLVLFPLAEDFEPFELFFFDRVAIPISFLKIRGDSLRSFDCIPSRS